MENLGKKLQLVYRSQADADAIADRGRTTAAAPEHLPSGARGLHGPSVVGGESLHPILACKRRVQQAGVMHAGQAAKLREQPFLQGQHGLAQNPLRLLHWASSRRVLR